MTRILQPSTDVPQGANYISSVPEHVLWGRLPARHDAFIGSVAPGGDIVIDTVSHEGLLPDQGSDPVRYFGGCGVPREEVLDDAVAIVAANQRDAVHDGPHVVTGPIEVPGAHPGDLLAISVSRLDRRVPYGVISTRHARGVLANVEGFDGNYGQFCRANGDRAEFALDNGGKISFPMRPFLGIMGVTVDSDERPNSIPPAEYGGNIDLNELTEGATLFLPVQIEGAGLYIGDPHFAQGNGEVALTALEASLRAELHIDVVPAAERRELFGDNEKPFAYAHGRIIPMGMDEDIDVALRESVRNAIEIISHLFAVPEHQAYLLLSAAVDFDVTQAVDLVAGAHGLIDTSLFKRSTGYEKATAFLAKFADHSLQDALEAYESALMSDDVATMSELFARDPDGVPVVRTDSAGMLAGHDAITAFRSKRGGAPSRTLTRRVSRMLGKDAAGVVSEFRKDAGGTVNQTQLWQRISGRWRIVDAHLTYPAPAIDARIWRVVGVPLVPPVVSKDDTASSSVVASPLQGMRVAVKDLFAVRGFAIGAGNPDYLAEAPIESANAPALQRLLEAGAAVQGIAQSDEFAYSLAGANVHYGTPPNPRAQGRISGGSTSGPASAVACGQVEIGLGTDTAGSIRIPASYQGLWGIRTTHDRVTREGVYPLSESFDTVGVLTRDGQTLALAAHALMPEADTVALDGSLAVCPALDECVQPDVQSAFTQFRTAASATLSTSPIAFTPQLLDDWLDIFATVRGFEAWRIDGAWVSKHWDSLAPEVAARFEHDSHITAEQYDAACQRLQEARAFIRAELGSRVLLIPSASSVAPLANPGADGLAAIEQARAQTLRLTGIAGVGGLPAVSVPCETADGLPCGACLVGPAGTDHALIALAAQLAEVH